MTLSYCPRRPSVTHALYTGHSHSDGAVATGCPTWAYCSGRSRQKLTRMLSGMDSARFESRRRFDDSILLVRYGGSRFTRPSIVSLDDAYDYDSHKGLIRTAMGREDRDGNVQNTVKNGRILFVAMGDEMRLHPS
ncbi:hypothetical protein J6590_017272 [Homalodisca vitripennis]|nr:hypothetical protein J6590_017272 [Homalodisca vitripennis]